MSAAALGKDPTVDDFLLRFAPQMDAIIAKNNIKARGNLYDDDLKSIAMTAAAKAYEDFEPGKGASLDAFASAAVKNAITDFNRKQHREFESSGGNVLNSDVFETAFDRKECTTLYEQEINVRSQWGKTGRAMQITALKLDDIASVQALFNKLHEGVPEVELRKMQM